MNIEMDPTEYTEPVNTNLERDEAEISILLEDLERAVSAEKRVQIFATYADTYGLDAVLSLLPAMGDGASSVISGVYLLFEAQRLGMSYFDRFKIFMHQAIDFAIGTVIPPGFDAPIDYAYQANKFSASHFEDFVEELSQKAIQAGATQQEVNAILNAKRIVSQQLITAVQTFANRDVEEDEDGGGAAAA
jgi:hypothetical protein